MQTRDLAKISELKAELVRLKEIKAENKTEDKDSVLKARENFSAWLLQKSTSTEPAEGKTEALPLKEKSDSFDLNLLDHQDPDLWTHKEITDFIDFLLTNEKPITLTLHNLFLNELNESMKKFFFAVLQHIAIEKLTLDFTLDYSNPTVLPMLKEVTKNPFLKAMWIQHDGYLFHHERVMDFLKFVAKFSDLPVLQISAQKEVKGQGPQRGLVFHKVDEEEVKGQDQRRVISYDPVSMDEEKITEILQLEINSWETDPRKEVTEFFTKNNLLFSLNRGPINTVLDYARPPLRIVFNAIDILNYPSRIEFYVNAIQKLSPEVALEFLDEKLKKSFHVDFWLAKLELYRKHYPAKLTRELLSDRAMRSYVSQSLGRKHYSEVARMYESFATLKNNDPIALFIFNFVASFFRGERHDYAPRLLAQLTEIIKNYEDKNTYTEDKYTNLFLFSVVFDLVESHTYSEYKSPSSLIINSDDAKYAIRTAIRTLKNILSNMEAANNLKPFPQASFSTMCSSTSSLLIPDNNASFRYVLGPSDVRGSINPTFWPYHPIQWNIQVPEISELTLVGKQIFDASRHAIIFSNAIVHAIQSYQHKGVIFYRFEIDEIRVLNAKDRQLIGCLKDSIEIRARFYHGDCLYLEHVATNSALIRDMYLHNSPEAKSVRPVTEERVLQELISQDPSNKKAKTLYAEVVTKKRLHSMIAVINTEIAAKITETKEFEKLTAIRKNVDALRDGGVTSSLLKILRKQNSVFFIESLDKLIKEFSNRIHLKSTLSGFKKKFLKIMNDLAPLKECSSGLMNVNYLQSAVTHIDHFLSGVIDDATLFDNIKNVSGALDRLGFDKKRGSYRLKMLIAELTPFIQPVTSTSVSSMGLMREASSPRPSPPAKSAGGKGVR